MSLRARLLIVTVGLVAVGLMVADLLTYRALATSLSQRLDEQLQQAQPFAVHALQQDGSGRASVSRDRWRRSARHRERTPRSSTHRASSCATPSSTPPAARRRRLQRCRPACPARPAAARAPTTFTASSTDGDRLPHGGDGAAARSRAPLVVGIPLTEAQATLHRLVGIELLVTLGVIVLVAGLAWWLVRVGLRPLEGIGETAGAIAAGDLSRRVEPADDRTEVGRLGTSLNTMLAQIEVAFEERRASRGAAAAIHRRRVARAADAADVDPRLRGAVPPRRGHAAGGPRDLDGADRGGGRAHGRARRRPAAARPAGPGPAARARARRPRAGCRRCGRCRARDRRLRGRSSSTLRRPRCWPATPGACARCSTTSWRTRACTRRRAPRPVCRSAPTGPTSCSRSPTKARGWTRTRPRRAFERFYRGDPARSRATGGAGSRAVDRRGHRRGPRRQGRAVADRLRRHVRGQDPGGPLDGRGV